MSDSVYIAAKQAIPRLQTEIARLNRQLTAMIELVTAYEEPIEDENNTDESAAADAHPSNGHIDIRFPQAAGGHRLRSGTLKYQVIRGAFDILVGQWPVRELHKREIIKHLQEKGILTDDEDHMNRVSVIFSQAKGILTGDGGGNWSIDPRCFRWINALAQLAPMPADAAHHGVELATAAIPETPPVVGAGLAPYGRPPIALPPAVSRAEGQIPKHERPRLRRSRAQE